MRINHVSVHARDLATSVAFYRRFFDARPVPTLNFGVPVQWLAIGDAQLHLFERDLVATRGHHFAVEVDDLVPVHRAARELGALDAEAFGHHLFLLPGDVAQMYVRDPAGNLVEVDAAGASALPEELRAELRDFTAQRPQTPEHLRARLPLHRLS
jgi:catechol 2,3-dioxygenase-like lactoylglutathione lyase family enzyme